MSPYDKPPKDDGYRYPKEGTQITDSMDFYDTFEGKWVAPVVTLGMTIDKDSVGRYRIPKK